MKQYEHIYFDLDGTLTDSEQGIVNSFKHACREFDIDCSAADFRSFLGPPLIDSFMSLTDGDRALSEKAIECYRAHFNPYGMIYENKLYDGITEMLEKLTQMNYKLFIATSKPETFTVKILDHFDMTDYFTGVYGAQLDGSRLHKEDILSFALEQNNSRLERSIMIGDRMYDLSAANKLGIDAVGVLYGYGTREELERYDHIFLAERPSDITDYFARIERG